MRCQFVTATPKHYIPLLSTAVHRQRMGRAIESSATRTLCRAVASAAHAVTRAPTATLRLFVCLFVCLVGRAGGGGRRHMPASS